MKFRHTDEGPLKIFARQIICIIVDVELDYYEVSHVLFKLIKLIFSQFISLDYTISLVSHSVQFLIF